MMKMPIKDGRCSDPSAAKAPAANSSESPGRNGVSTCVTSQLLGLRFTLSTAGVRLGAILRVKVELLSGLAEG